MLFVVFVIHYRFGIFGPVEVTPEHKDLSPSLAARSALLPAPSGRSLGGSLHEYMQYGT